jgi:drug/metabolite transporter (DMT)-like permease
MRAKRGSKFVVHAAVACCLILWASSFVVIRVAVREYSPEHLALLRYLVASAVLLIAAPFCKVRLPKPRHVPAFFGMGIVGIAFYSLAVNAGEMTVTAGGASLIIASETVFVALLAGAFLKERIPRLAWFGFALSLIGVALISLSSVADLNFSVGSFLLLAASVAAAALTVWQKAYLDRYSAVEVSAYCVWAGTLCLLFAAPGLAESMATAQPLTTWLAVYLGVGPAALAYTAWTYALKRTDAAVLSASLYLTSPMTVIIAWFALGELPSAPALLGGAVVLLGVWLAQHRK